jgi:predicted ArsR family transcriptional regulator
MPAETATRTTASPSLVALLGATRAAIVEALRSRPGRSATDLAAHLGITAVATRRHLALLEEEGLVEAHTVRQGRGRPAARYHLTDTAGRLLPHRYDQLASEVLEFLSDRDGREGLRAFLRWRMQREIADLGALVTAEDLHERLSQLAQALSDAGFDASVDGDGARFRLIQGHCTIEGVAKEHPEVCAYEAASFAKVLGTDVTVSRRETLATGSQACVCTVSSKRPHAVRDDAASAAGRAESSEHGDAS